MKWLRVVIILIALMTLPVTVSASSPSSSSLGLLNGYPVDFSGLIQYLNSCFATSLNASITKDQAIQIAESSDYFEGYIPSSVDAKLDVGYGYVHKPVWVVQILCDFSITGQEGVNPWDHRGGTVVVDAKTGNVILVDPCR